MPPALTQAPQTITITSKTAPVRLGSYPAPYLILNTSVTDTVWISDDPSVATGLAIPLYPGGKLRRTVGGDVWGILDSAATASVTVILAFTVDQWDPNVAAIAQAIVNSGTLLIDNPVAVIPATSITTSADNWFPAANSVYDVRTLQSIFLSYFIDGTHAHTVLLTLSWYGSINATPFDLVGGDSFQWSSGDTASLVGEQLPVRGSFLRVDAFIAGAPGIDTIAIVGSHRTWNPLARSAIGSRSLIAIQSVALGAGAAMTGTPLSRYDGPVIVSAGYVPGAAADNIDWQIQDLVTVKPVATGSLSGSSNAVLGHTVAAATPRNTWNIVLVNRSAGPRNCFLSVVMVPD